MSPPVVDSRGLYAQSVAKAGVQRRFMDIVDEVVLVATHAAFETSAPGLIGIRGFAMGIAVLEIWTADVAISFAFPPLLAALSATPTYGLFALINVGSWVLARKLAPETRGRSLQELEDDFRTHAPADLVRRGPAGVQRRLSSPAPARAPAAFGLPGVAGARASGAGQTSRGRGQTTSRSCTHRPPTTSRARHTPELCSGVTGSPATICRWASPAASGVPWASQRGPLQGTEVLDAVEVPGWSGGGARSWNDDPPAAAAALTRSHGCPRRWPRRGGRGVGPLQGSPPSPGMS